jgi:hypothetical protein
MRGAFRVEEKAAFGRKSREKARYGITYFWF